MYVQSFSCYILMYIVRCLPALLESLFQTTRTLGQFLEMALQLTVFLVVQGTKIGPNIKGFNYEKLKFW